MQNDGKEMIAILDSRRGPTISSESSTARKVILKKVRKRLGDGVTSVYPVEVCNFIQL